MKHIMKCPKCEKYTMKEACCGLCVKAQPPKFSPIDAYADYRRKAKKHSLMENGLL